MRSILVAVALLLPALAGAESISKKADQGDVVFMRDEDPAMQKAFARAGATLDDFLGKVRAASPMHTSFALKVAISEGATTEYFWVNNFAQKADGSFEGDIANDARLVKRVKFGQRHAFPRAHVVDWTYIDKGTRGMAGNFTLCALLTKEPAAQAEEMKARFKLDCSWLTR